MEDDPGYLRDKNRTAGQNISAWKTLYPVVERVGVGYGLANHIISSEERSTALGASSVASTSVRPRPQRRVAPPPARAWDSRSNNLQ